MKNHLKNKNNNKDLVNTTSFLQSIEISSTNTDINTYAKESGQKDIDEIITKYLNLKKKINLLYNK